MVATVIPKSSRPKQFLFHHCLAKALQGPTLHGPSNSSAIKISSRYITHSLTCRESFSEDIGSQIPFSNFLQHSIVISPVRQLSHTHTHVCVWSTCTESPLSVAWPLSGLWVPRLGSFLLLATAHKAPEEKLHFV